MLPTVVHLRGRHRHSARACWCATPPQHSTWHGQRGESTLGLATLRLDGFVSVQSAGFTEGVVVTRPHHWQARELRVNVESLTGGLKVQLQDETGLPFDVFPPERWSRSGRTPWTRP